MLIVGARGAGQGREAPEGSLEARRALPHNDAGSDGVTLCRVKAACLPVSYLPTVKSSALTMPATCDKVGLLVRNQTRIASTSDVRLSHRSRFRCEAKDDVVQGPVSDMRRARPSAARHARAVAAPAGGPCHALGARPGVHVEHSKDPQLVMKKTRSLS